MIQPLEEYIKKRNFKLTSEPENDQNHRRQRADSLDFVIQKHAARRLHYDLRLEIDGTLKSWAVPKGPSLDPTVKRLAVHVEDHPLSYADFEGLIPEGQYGAGQVIVWDKGTWQPENGALKAYKAGNLSFTLNGEKLRGSWKLIRTRSKDDNKKNQWLLIKQQDHAAKAETDYNITQQRPESVLSGIQIGDKPGNTIVSADVKTAATNEVSANKPSDKPDLTRAKKVKIPQQLSPQLATLLNRPPAGEWLYEIKYDGYRILARIIGGEVRLFTRNGHDWTSRLPQLAQALSELKPGDSWLDGEVVALNDEGLPDFQALQNAFDTDTDQLVYFLFDCPYLNGRDMRYLPVEQRRAALKHALTPCSTSLIRYSDTFNSDYHSIFASACAMSLEGLIAKRIGSHYVSERSADWVKLKCVLRQEFVIVGYTAPKGNRSGFGALLLAVHDKPGGNLRYAGRVGTGFSNNLLDTLHKKLEKLQQKKPALTHVDAVPEANNITWVKPTLVCEIEFGQWTKQQIIRHASFVGLRDDKPAAQIAREKPLAADKLPTGKTAATNSASAGSGTNKVAGVHISSADRVIDTSSQTTKKDLALFYAAISPAILPHLQHRPVSLLRAPEGVAGEQFFQKHSNHLSIPHITQLDPALDPGHDSLMTITNKKALVGCSQMGTIELHTWGATTDEIEKPDRLVLDLDPDPELPWQNMIEACQLVMSVLDELELSYFLKTSGGKGMHIVLPLARYHNWSTVKSFAKLISQFMASNIPVRFVAKMGPKNRVGKIFIDYLRNHRGASTVAAYSVRARPGLPVSVPITHAELAGLQSSAQWHIGNVRQRLAELQTDPWQGYNNRQRIGKNLWQKLGGVAPKA